MQWRLKIELQQSVVEVVKVHYAMLLMMANNRIFLKLGSAHAEITNKFSLQPLHQYTLVCSLSCNRLILHLKKIRYLIVQSKTISNIYEFLSFLSFGHCSAIILIYSYMIFVALQLLGNWLECIALTIPPRLGLFCQAFLLTNKKRNSIIWKSSKVSVFLSFFPMCDLWHLLVSAHIFISIWTDGLHFLCYQSMATLLRTYLLEHSSSICLGAYISPRRTLAAL